MAQDDKEPDFKALAVGIIKRGRVDEAWVELERMYHLGQEVEAAKLIAPGGLTVNCMRLGNCAERERLLKRLGQSTDKEMVEAVDAVFKDWPRPSAIRLHAGEMTAQEMRTARAVLGGVHAAGLQAIRRSPAPAHDQIERVAAIIAELAVAPSVDGEMVRSVARKVTEAIREPTEVLRGVSQKIQVADAVRILRNADQSWDWSNLSSMTRNAIADLIAHLYAESKAKHGEPRGRSVGALTRVGETASLPALDIATKIVMDHGILPRILTIDLIEHAILNERAALISAPAGDGWRAGAEAMRKAILDCAHNEPERLTWRGIETFPLPSPPAPGSKG